MWREWEGVTKRLQCPSHTRAPVLQKTLSGIVLTQTKRHLLSGQQHRNTSLWSSYLEISYLSRFYFFCANCCATMTTVLLMWYLVSLKLNWHSTHSAAICSIGGPIKWLKSKPLCLFRSSKKLVSDNNWVCCLLKWALSRCGFFFFFLPTKALALSSEMCLVFPSGRENCHIAT